MKSIFRSLFVVLMLLSLSISAIAENNLAREKAMFSQLMQAISQNDYKSFISNGNSQFKSGITKQAFDSLANQVGDLVRGGYKAEYLAELNQQGNRVYLWKISYDTSSENTLAKLVIINNKVAGFWLQ